MKRTASAFKYGVPLFVYCAIIFSVSALTSPPAPEYPFQWGDKINHALAYAVMCLLAFRSTRLLRERPQRARVLIALIFCIVYGGTDEIHQKFVPGRVCDAYDWIADVVGASAIALTLPRMIRWKPVAMLVGERSKTANEPPRTA